MRVGIFFGGNSREREVSFAGGRTVYDNLDKNLFEAVPIFVDSFNNFILLDWHLIYKGSIRDFYPPVQALQAYPGNFSVYAESLDDAYADRGIQLAKALGKVIRPEDLHRHIDFAFLALHGSFGEDGTIQGLLEWQKIPYSGSGILPSALGMHKKIQKTWMQAAGFAGPKWKTISKTVWKSTNHQSLHDEILANISLPFVVKPANQGSSVGVSVISTTSINDFINAINKSFFILILTKKEWQRKSDQDKLVFLQKLADVKEGISFPLTLNGQMVFHPHALKRKLDLAFKKLPEVTLESIQSETECLIEEFIRGREFSCIVVQDEGKEPIALPPTEIVKGQEVYDYRSKYLPGLSRKVTPIDIPVNLLQQIRKECVRLFSYFQFNVYARIDGFISDKGEIFLNDPNTTSGMMPSSFFFHQAAEIGLNPSQFLTFIIRASLYERSVTWPEHIQVQERMREFDKKLASNQKKSSVKKRVAVMMGGYSTERHISVESGRNIYEKLASSVKYLPFPVFVTGNEKSHSLHLIPINVMLKDNADDIREKVFHFKQNKAILGIIEECKSIIRKYGNEANLFAPKEITYKELAQRCDAVFIALHGRPGEDGTVQKELMKYRLPFNGSGVESSQITINKYDTNELLKQHGFLVADHLLVYEKDWKSKRNEVLRKIESMGFPLIAKPADDGCSSAVKKIKNEKEFMAYAEGVFRKSLSMTPAMAASLGLKDKEEFPKKHYFLIEKFIDRQKAVHFLEITGGMLTSFNKQGKLIFESFEASEALAEGDILSLEEKFLAGQGQNITPARYHKNETIRKTISKKVQQTLVSAAKVLKVEGYCRIDAFVRIDRKNQPEVIFIEVNSLPGMTPATAIFHQCALNNYKPYEFIDAILEFGTTRQNKT